MKREGIITSGGKVLPAVDPVLRLLPATADRSPHPTTVAEFHRVFARAAMVVEGLDRDAEMSGEFAGRKHRLEAGERVQSVHAQQVRERCRVSPRRTWCEKAERPV